MPALTIPDETYAHLARLAAARGTTVEAVALPLLRQATEEPADSPNKLSYEEWKKRADAFLENSRKALAHLPPGHVLDDSRESIYEGCGE